MKKALVILVALAFAAPLYAGTINITTTDNEDGTCNIDWTSTGGVVAMGLDIDVTVGPDEIGGGELGGALEDVGIDGEDGGRVVVAEALREHLDGVSR